MFKQRNVPMSELISTPTPRYAGQPLDFRPPEGHQAPSWWQGPRCGECGAGGGLGGLNVIHQWWRDLAHDDDPFVIQLVCEDLIVGSDVRRFVRSECRIKNDQLNSLQLQRLSGLAKKAADLLDG